MAAAKTPTLFGCLSFKCIIREKLLKRFKWILIASLLAFALCAGLLFRSTTNHVKEGVEHWTKYYLISNSIGVAERSYQNDRWNERTIVFGDGNYCIIEEGGHELNSTGGWYFRLGIQLPDEIDVGYSTSVRCVRLSARTDLHKLDPGEMVAMQFGNPASWTLTSMDESALGSLTIVKSDAESVTVRVDVAIPLTSIMQFAGEEILKINRQFRLERVSVLNPIAALPRKSRVIK